MEPENELTQSAPPVNDAAGQELPTFDPVRNQAMVSAKTRIAGTDLVPTGDYKKATQPEYKYWVGVHPRCPVEHVDVAGVNFPKVTELVGSPLSGRSPS
jgi:hypothetical protein